MYMVHLTNLSENFNILPFLKSVYSFRCAFFPRQKYDDANAFKYFLAFAGNFVNSLTENISNNEKEFVIKKLEFF